MSVEVSIERFIVDQLLLGNGPEKISPDESLISNGILDSLALLQLIFFIEENYGITVEDGEVIPDNFQSINQIKTFIEDKRRAS